MHRNLKFLHMTNFSPHISLVILATNIRYGRNSFLTFRGAAGSQVWWSEVWHGGRDLQWRQTTKIRLRSVGLSTFRRVGGTENGTYGRLPPLWGPPAQASRDPNNVWRPSPSCKGQSFRWACVTLARIRLRQSGTKYGRRRFSGVDVCGGGLTLVYLTSP